MERERIEIGKDGFKFSYHRFVSDSALGFVLVLMLLPKFLYLEHTFLEHFNLELSSFYKILVVLIFIFLSTPIGLLINGIGWLFFEKITDDFAYYIFRLLEKRFCLVSFFLSKEELLWKFSLRSISRKEYHYFVSLFSTYIDIGGKGKHFRLDPARAVVKFLRGLLFLFLLLPFIYGDIPFLRILMLVSFLILVLSGLKTYVHSEIVKLAVITYNEDYMTNSIGEKLKSLGVEHKSTNSS